MTRAELDAHVWADGHWMNTASGRRFPVLDPTPESFDIVDIAIALGNVARYGGHTRGHYSVAKHSIVVSMAVELAGGSLDEQRWGLMHDAAEAYYGDVPWPLIAAGLVPELRAAEKRGMALMAQRFGLSPDEPQIVKNFDLEALEVESEKVLTRHPNWLVARRASDAMRMAWDVEAYWTWVHDGLGFIRRAVGLGLAIESDIDTVRKLVWRDWYCGHCGHCVAEQPESTQHAARKLDDVLVRIDMERAR